MIPWSFEKHIRTINRIIVDDYGRMPTPVQANAIIVQNYLVTLRRPSSAWRHAPTVAEALRSIDRLIEDYRKAKV